MRGKVDSPNEWLYPRICAVSKHWQPKIWVGFVALPYNWCSSETLVIRVGFLSFTQQFVLFGNIDN